MPPDSSPSSDRADPEGGLVIPLRKPIAVKGKAVLTELRLREPTAGEVFAASRETGRGLALSLLRQVTGADQAAIEALPARVSDQALAHLMSFIEPLIAAEETPAEELPDELTVTLPHTLQAGTTWLDKLELREPTLGELIKADKHTGMQRTIALVALVSGVSRVLIELVPISVFTAAAAYVLGFTDAAPKPGGASSDG